MAEELGSGCPRVRPGRLTSESFGLPVAVEGPKGEEAARWESLDEAANFAAKETSEGPRRRDHVQLRGRQPRCEGSAGSPKGEL